MLDLDGYEGPIDLLLALAREQKVDLARSRSWRLPINTSPLLPGSVSLRLEIAADYLVMAAWLAYLKSRLLLPQPPEDDEPSAAELAAALEQRLKLLEAMQSAGRRLMARPRLGHDVFLRGAPEGLAVIVGFRSTSSASTSCCGPMARAAAAARQIVLAIEPSDIPFDG